MTYIAERDKLSRSPLYIVELDLDTKISSTGKEYLSQGEQPFGQEFWPCVQSVKWIPTRAKEEGGLGSFGDVTIKCKDFKVGAKGTYFGKLIASNPYYLNRLVKIHVGFFKSGDTFSFSNFKERRYFLKRIDGPDFNGNVTIQASDIMSRLAESETPTPTKGNLSASITSTATGDINIVTNEGFPTSGYCMIDDEIVFYNGLVSTTSITVISRGQGGTDAEAHDADAPARYIYNYNGNPIDAIVSLIEDHTAIVPSYLDDVGMDEERDTFFNGDIVDIWVKEPKKVSEIIDKIGAQNYLNIWWDDEGQKIRLKTLGPTLQETTEWNDEEHILNTSVNIKRDQRKILTAIWFYYGKINQAKGNDAENFENVYIAIDTALETALGEEKVKKIYADYIPSGGTGTAGKVTSRLISQNKLPLDLTLYVDSKDSDIMVGDAVNISTDLEVDANGDRNIVKMRVVERSEEENNRYRYRMIYSGLDSSAKYAKIGPNTLLNYTQESTANHYKYGWISDNSGKMSNGDDGYLIS